MIRLIFYLCLALGISFFCSLFEAVILSVSHAYADRLLKEKHRSGKLLKSLKTNLDSSLAAILTLNTIAHTIGAAGVGAEVLKIFGDKWVAGGSVILTALILVFSEIIPKTLGASYWRTLAPTVAYGIKLFILLTYPFVLVFESLSRKLSPKKGRFKRITRDELMYVAEIGYSEGSLSDNEIKIIKNLLKLKSILVKDVMTPRTVVFALPKEMLIAEVLEKYPAIPFSRIPVYQKSIDSIVGLVMRYEILDAQSSEAKEEKLESIMHPIHGVPFSVSVSGILEEFISRREHIFAVFDEHGGVDGVVTLEDAIETLLGVEIIDEFDSVEDMRKYAVEQWAKRRAERDKKKKKS